MVSPYDYAASTAYAASHPSYDACIARGFAYGASVQSWRGDPGAAPPLANNVETADGRRADLARPTALVGALGLWRPNRRRAGR